MAQLSGRQAEIAISAGLASTSWFMAGTVGANAGLLANIDNIAMDADLVVDESPGFAEAEYLDVNEYNVAPTLTIPFRRTGALYRVITGVFGDDTVTGAGPYTHTFNWQEETQRIYTLAARVNTGNIIEFQNVLFTGFTLKSGGDGYAELTANAIGNVLRSSGATNTDTQFNALTYISKTLRVPNRELRFRINSQSGAALGSGDVLKLSNFELSAQRPFDKEMLTQGVSTGVEFQSDVPVQNGVSEISLTIEQNELSTWSLLDDLKSENRYKADLYWAKTVGTAYSFLVELGNLAVMPAQAPIENGNRISHSRVFKGLKPQSIPTAMATANSIHAVLVDGYNTTYE